MPLPFAIHFVDKDSVVREDVAVKAGKPSGYVPTIDYHPTYKVVRCKDCMTVGVAEFVNGFDLKAGDRLMDGKPITGLCLKCNKETELVPLAPNLKHMEPGLVHFYRVQQALDEAVKRGECLGPSGMIWPLARVLDNERRRAAATGGDVRGG